MKNLKKKMGKVGHFSKFGERVFDVVRAIPRGSALSYGEVAKRAGNPGAARAVGTLMKNNRDKTVPCHRVIKSDGSLGEYNRLGGKSKSDRLKEEGYLK